MGHSKNDGFVSYVQNKYRVILYTKDKTIDKIQSKRHANRKSKVPQLLRNECTTIASSFVFYFQEFVQPLFYTYLGLFNHCFIIIRVCATIDRRYTTELLPIRRKTLSNSINQCNHYLLEFVHPCRRLGLATLLNPKKEDIK